MVERRSYTGSERQERNEERLIALFLVGAVAFSPLALGLFDAGADVTVFGIPLLYVYTFGVWLGLLGLMAMVTEIAGRSHRRQPPPAVPPRTDGRS